MNKQTTKHRSSKNCSSKRTSKSKEKKVNLNLIEEASTRFAEILMKQIELNKTKNHSVEDSGLKYLML